MGIGHKYREIGHSNANLEIRTYLNVFESY
jgi:hypothetical protein